VSCVSRRLTPVILLLLLLHGAPGQSQDLSTAVYTTEEDLREALERQELSYERYKALLDLLKMGIEPDETYLLNLVPNISEQFRRDSAIETQLAEQQAETFVAAPKSASRVHVRQEWSREAERTGRGRYRTRIRWRPHDNWKIDLRLQREYTGRERITARTVAYRDNDGPVRRIEIGSFTARFGLGTLVGYRGKLLSAGDSLTWESALFPDCGGFNGTLLVAQAGGFGISSLVSHQRDSEHALQTAALEIDPGSSPLPVLIASHNRLRQRLTDRSLSATQVALFQQLRYGRSAIKAEVGYQFYPTACLAGQFLGRHRFQQVDLTYAAWFYGDQFVTLSSGGRAATISRRLNYESVGFGLSERRAGQDGLRVRAVTAFNQTWQTVTALSYGGFDPGQYRLEVLPGVIYHLDTDLSIRLDYLLTYREQLERYDRFVRQRRRLEGRFQSGLTAVRVYIALTTENDGTRYGSGLVQVRQHLADGSSIEMRTRIAEYRDRSIRYWSGSLSLRQQLGARIELTTSMHYRYNATAANRHYPQVELETNIYL